MELLEQFLFVFIFSAVTATNAGLVVSRKPVSSQVPRDIYSATTTAQVVSSSIEPTNIPESTTSRTTSSGFQKIRDTHSSIQSTLQLSSVHSSVSTNSPDGLDLKSSGTTIRYTTPGESWKDTKFKKENIDKRTTPTSDSPPTTLNNEVKTTVSVMQDPKVGTKTTANLLTKNQRLGTFDNTAGSKLTPGHTTIQEAHPTSSGTPKKTFLNMMSMKQTSKSYKTEEHPKSTPGPDPQTREEEIKVSKGKSTVSHVASNGVAVMQLTTSTSPVPWQAKFLSTTTFGPKDERQTDSQSTKTFSVPDRGQTTTRLTTTSISPLEMQTTTKAIRTATTTTKSRHPVQDYIKNPVISIVSDPRTSQAAEPTRPKTLYPPPIANIGTGASDLDVKLSTALHILCEWSALRALHSPPIHESITGDTGNDFSEIEKLLMKKIKSLYILEIPLMRFKPSKRLRRKIINIRQRVSFNMRRFHAMGKVEWQVMRLKERKRERERRRQHQGRRLRHRHSRKRRRRTKRNFILNEVFRFLDTNRNGIIQLGDIEEFLTVRGVMKKRKGKNNKS